MKDELNVGQTKDVMSVMLRDGRRASPRKRHLERRAHQDKQAEHPSSPEVLPDEL